MTPLEAARTKLGLSQSEVARRVGVKPFLIWRIERTKCKASARTAEKIVVALDGAVTEEQLLFPERFFGLRRLPKKRQAA